MALRFYPTLCSALTKQFLPEVRGGSAELQSRGGWRTRSRRLHARAYRWVPFRFLLVSYRPLAPLFCARVSALTARSYCICAVITRSFDNCVADLARLPLLQD